MTENNEETKRATRSPWSRRSDRAKLAPDAAVRQGRVTQLALEAFDTKEAAIAYLNTASTPLGGRPLDLATHSAEGLGKVADDLMRKP